MFRGDLSLVIDRPVSMTLLSLGAAFLVYRLTASFWGKQLSLKIEAKETL